MPNAETLAAVPCCNHAEGPDFRRATDQLLRTRSRGGRRNHRLPSELQSEDRQPPSAFGDFVIAGAPWRPAERINISAFDLQQEIAEIAWIAWEWRIAPEPPNGMARDERIRLQALARCPP